MEENVLSTPPRPRSPEQTSPPLQTRSRFQPESCIKELVFGRAPLSITGNAQSQAKVSSSDDACDNCESEKQSPKHRNAKRKADTEVPEYTNKVAKTELIELDSDFSDNSTDSRGTFDDNEHATSRVTSSSRNNQDHHLISEQSTCNNNADYTHSANPDNFNPSLQADWTLPCFKTILAHPSKSPNHNSNAELQHHYHHLEEDGSVHQNPENKENMSVPINMDSRAVCSGSVAELDHASVLNAMQMWNAAAARFHTTEGQSASVMSETGRPQQLSLAQSRSVGPTLPSHVLQPIQLSNGQGEIMIMPQDTQHNGPIIFVQPCQLPSATAARMAQLSPQNPLQFDNQSPLQTSTPLSNVHHGSITTFQQKRKVPNPNTVHLNSSGEETDNSVDITGDDTSPTRAPYPADLQEQLERVKQGLPMDPPFFNGSDEGDPSREQHNHKERVRRARIRDACHLMRQLVPGMSDKTDKATVFEFGARYVHFLRSFVGNQFDKEFLMKYSPY